LKKTGIQNISGITRGGGGQVTSQSEGTRRKNSGIFPNKV